MTEPKFSQPAGRNLLAPILIAIALLGAAIALLVRYTPHKVADVSVTHAVVYSTHTVFKSDNMMLNRTNEQDDLYVPVTVSITDRLNLPLFLKDLTATLVTADGEEVAATAAYKNDLPSLYITFPALKPLASEPLVREVQVKPGETAQGMVLLHFPISSEIWNQRRSATLNIDLYHQGPLKVELPQDLKADAPKH